MIKILDLNDNSKDIEIGTINVDRVYGGRGGKKVAGMINEIPEGSFLIYEKFIVLHL